MEFDTLEDVLKSHVADSVKVGHPSVQQGGAGQGAAKNKFLLLRDFPSLKDSTVEQPVTVYLAADETQPIYGTEVY